MMYRSRSSFVFLPQNYRVWRRPKIIFLFFSPLMPTELCFNSSVAAMWKQVDLSVSGVSFCDKYVETENSWKKVLWYSLTTEVGTACPRKTVTTLIWQNQENLSRETGDKLETRPECHVPLIPSISSLRQEDHICSSPAWLIWRDPIYINKS